MRPAISPGTFLRALEATSDKRPFAMSTYYESLNDPVTAKSIAEQYGFCHVKGVFSPDEMAMLEQGLANAHREFGANVPDLFSIPSLKGLLFHERIRAFAHALLGEKLVYYRETNAAYEEVPGPLTHRPFAEYHCDARGTSSSLPGAPGHSGSYPAYRFGIYFRNYRDHSGGLKVAPGSHLRDYLFDRRLCLERFVAKLPVARHRIGAYDVSIGVAPMELYNVPSVPGDLVIFSLRCFHSAGAIRLKDRPTLALLPVVEAQLPPSICIPPPPGTRNAIFLDYGAPHAAVDYYIKWRAGASFSATANIPYDYKTPVPDWMVMRNDKVIVALAHKVVAGEGQPDRQEAADLVALCRSHKEFAPEHALFARPAFEANLARNNPNTARDVARDIVERQNSARASSPEL